MRQFGKKFAADGVLWNSAAVTTGMNNENFFMVKTVNAVIVS
ncbi:hypothetical protein SDC9_143624 [bioreactor metagenome]|uniref:Uncharacterized protein n=1 Tax=bioreactor metagenome TaxID=1076179 RepID=A0A645E4F9_9ZZZZ